MANPSDLAAGADEELIGRVRWRDYPAFVTLFDRYRPRIMAYAARMAGDADQAENLAHDIFLRMVNEASKFDQVGSFRAWLFRLAREQISEFVAKNRPEPRASLEHVSAANDGAGRPDVPAQARQTYAALNRLGAVYREVLYLRLFERMSYQEIGEITGERPPTVKSRMNYAIEQLRKEVR